MEGNQTSNITGALSEFLQGQGLNINEIWQPAADIIENENNIVVYINIPGVKNESIDVDFFNNRVIVKGERKRPFSVNAVIVKNEIIYGTFERQVILPISVTARENVKINVKNGVLVIIIDKTREERNRFSVRVSSSSSRDPE